MLGQDSGHEARSAAGTCSATGFACDHLTILKEGRSVLLQFTENAGRYSGMSGTANSGDPTVIDLDQVYLDGHQIGSTGQCVLNFESGELSQVICPALTFTVRNGE